MEPYVLAHSNLEIVTDMQKGTSSSKNRKKSSLYSRTNHGSSNIKDQPTTSSIISAYETELAMMEKELSRQRGNNAKLEEKIKQLAIKLSVVRTRPLLALIDETDVDYDKGAIEFKLSAAAEEEERVRKWKAYTGSNSNLFDNDDEINSTHEDFGRKNNIEATQYQEKRMRALEQHYRNKIMLRKLNETDERVQEIRGNKKFSKCK